MTSPRGIQPQLSLANTQITSNIKDAFYNFHRKDYSSATEHFAVAITELEAAEIDNDQIIIMTDIVRDLLLDNLKNYYIEDLKVKNKEQMLAMLYARRGIANQVFQNNIQAIEDYEKSIKLNPNAHGHHNALFLQGKICLLKWEMNQEFPYLTEAMFCFEKALELNPSIKYTLSDTGFKVIERTDFRTKESHYFFNLGLSIYLENHDNKDKNLSNRPRFSKCLLQRANDYLTNKPTNFVQALSDYLAAFKINPKVFKQNPELLGPTGHVVNHILTHLGDESLDPEANELLLELLQLEKKIPNIISYEKLNLETLPFNSKASHLAFDLCYKVINTFSNWEQRAIFSKALIVRSKYFLEHSDEDTTYWNQVLIDCKTAFDLHPYMFKSNQELIDSHPYFYEVLSKNAPLSEEWKLVFNLVCEMKDKTKDKKFFFDRCHYFLALCETKENTGANIIKSLYCLQQALLREKSTSPSTSVYISHIFSSIYSYMEKSQILLDSEIAKEIKKWIELVDKEKALSSHYQARLNYLNASKGDVNSIIGALNANNALNKYYAKRGMIHYESRDLDILVSLFKCKETDKLAQHTGPISEFLKKIEKRNLLNSIDKFLSLDQCAELLKQCMDTANPLRSTYKLGIFKLNENEDLNLSKEITEFTKAYPKTMKIAFFKNINSLIGKGETFWGSLIYFKLLLDADEITQVFGAINKFSADDIADLLKQCNSRTCLLRNHKKLNIILDFIFNKLSENKLTEVLSKMSVTDIKNSILLFTPIQQQQIIQKCLDSKSTLSKRLMKTARNEAHETLKTVNLSLYKGTPSLEDLKKFQNELVELKKTIKAMTDLSSFINNNISSDKKWWDNMREEVCNLVTTIETKIAEPFKSANQSINKQSDTEVLLTENTQAENWKNAFAKVCKEQDAIYFIKNSQNFLDSYEKNKNFNDVIKALYFFHQAVTKGIDRKKYFNIIDDINSYMELVHPTTAEGKLLYMVNLQMDPEKALIIRCQAFLTDFEKTNNVDSLILAFNDHTTLSEITNEFGIDKKNADLFYSINQYIFPALVKHKIYPTLIKDIMILDKKFGLIVCKLTDFYKNKNTNSLIEALSDYNNLCGIDKKFAEEDYANINQYLCSELSKHLPRINNKMLLNAIAELTQKELAALLKESATYWPNSLWNFHLSFLIYGHSILENDIDIDYREMLRKISLYQIIESIKKLPPELEKKLITHCKNPMSILGERLQIIAMERPEEKQAANNFLSENGLKKTGTFSIRFDFNRGKKPILPVYYDIDELKKEKEKSLLDSVSNFFFGEKTEKQPKREVVENKPRVTSLRNNNNN